MNSNKGSLKQVEFEFTALIGAVTEIKHKHSSKFYLVWKIVHDSQGKEIVGTQYLEPDKNGVIGFSTELKASVKIIYNKETNTYLKKKSMLCLNYKNDDDKEAKLGGLVTIDLASLASKMASSSGFIQYTLQRSPFKGSTVTIKIVSKKLKEELINSFSWDSKELSFQSLMERSNVSSLKNSMDKRSNGNRKNISKMIKDQFIDKRTATQVCEQPIKQLLQKQRLESQLRQQKEQNQLLLSKIHILQSQNQKLKDTQLSCLTSQRSKTLQSQLLQISNQQSTILIQQSDYTSLLQQNKYILNQLESVSLKLAKREQEMSIVKCQFEKLKKKEKEKEKERKREGKQESVELEHQLYYLSQEVMRLHEELANYRETQVENNQLKRDREVLQERINEMKSYQKGKDEQISRLKQSLHFLSTLPTQQQPLLDTQNLLPTFKPSSKSFLTTSIPSLRSSQFKQNLSDVTFKYNNQNMNSKLQDIANEVLKLKNVSLNGMTMQNKKNFLTVVKRLEGRVSEAGSV